MCLDMVEKFAILFCFFQPSNVKSVIRAPHQGEHSEVIV